MKQVESDSPSEERTVGYGTCLSLGASVHVEGAGSGTSFTEGEPIVVPANAAFARPSKEAS
jgi:hypothetical protein